MRISSNWFQVVWSNAHYSALVYIIPFVYLWIVYTYYQYIVTDLYSICMMITVNLVIASRLVPCTSASLYISTYIHVYILWYSVN